MKVPDTVVLITFGLQVPVMPLVEVFGNAGGTLFWHSGPICVNVGTTCGVIVMLIVVTTPHCVGSFGVKV